MLQFASAIIPPRGAPAGVANELGGGRTGQQQATSLEPDMKAQRQMSSAGSTDAQIATAPAPAGGFPAPQLTHLVLVAGHAVYTGLDFAVANMESSWFLEPYQQVITSHVLLARL